jgi:L-ascorbate metabolism protein UlaG (beta-lactamase superfamily)
MNEDMKKIHWYGQAAFFIDGSVKVFFDPFNIGSAPKADVIFVTHTHRDHFSVKDIMKVARKDSTLVAPPVVIPDFPGRVITMKPKDIMTVRGMTVETIPAYNRTLTFHPKSNNWFGFIITIDGMRIYHAGDTDFVPEMEGLAADIGMVPVGGTYTMDAAEAARAVRGMKLKSVVPMHWGDIVGSKKDAEEFRRLVGDAAEVIIMDQET